jgi:hypothetical protein
MIVKWRIRLLFGWAIEFVRYYPEAAAIHDSRSEGTTCHE